MGNLLLFNLESSEDGCTHFDRATSPFRCPFAAFETNPVALTPGSFSHAEDRIELAGDPEVEREGWRWGA